jgi:ankyrin repeat protein
MEHGRCKAVSDTSAISCDATMPSSSLLMEAASTGNTALLDYALQLGLDVNMVAEDGYTALHCAARAGKTAMIQQLLQLGAALDYCNTEQKKRRPIHEAIHERHAAAVALLLQAGSDMVLRDGNGKTVIDYVGSVGDVKVAEAVFEAIPTQDTTDKMVSELAVVATREGSAILLEWLLRRFPNAMSQFTNLWMSPIYIASIRGHLEILKLLLTHVEKRNAFGSDTTRFITHSMCIAAGEGDAHIVELLLTYKAVDVNTRPKYYLTALCSAILRGREQVVQILLRRVDLDVNLSGYQGSKTLPLCYAIRNKYHKILRLLLDDNRIDVNKEVLLTSLWDRSLHGTVLHFAIQCNNVTAVRLLLDHKNINPNLPYEGGRTPAEFAKQRDLSEMMQLFADRGLFETQVEKVLSSASSTEMRYGDIVPHHPTASHHNQSLTNLEAQPNSAISESLEDLVSDKSDESEEESTALRDGSGWTMQY